ncbi:MAG: peptidylprolyl isomerase [Pseudomonadota bacterium]
MTTRPILWILASLKANVGLLVLLALVSSWVAGGAAAQSDGRILAMINGEPLYEHEYRAYLETLSEEVRARADEPGAYRELLEHMINIRLLELNARALKLDQDPGLQALIDAFAQSVLVDRYLRLRVDEQITMEYLQGRYDALKANTVLGQETRASHILVETEGEAQTLIDRLDAGEDFASLASAHSIGPSAQSGGDLGFFASGQMVQPFELATGEIAVGNWSKEPVQTQFGWHVIKVFERRDQQFPSFEELEQNLRVQEQQALVEQIISDHVSAAVIERFDLAGEPLSPAAPSPQ